MVATVDLGGHSAPDVEVADWPGRQPKVVASYEHRRIVFRMTVVEAVDVVEVETER